MKKIAITGQSGSGKSTTAKILGEFYDLPVFDLDKIILGADMKKPPTVEYRKTVQKLVDRHQEWVIEGVYPKVADIIWPKADVLIWFDLPIGQASDRYHQRHADGKTKGPFANPEVYQKEYFRLKKVYQELVDSLELTRVIRVFDENQDVIKLVENR